MKLIESLKHLESDDLTKDELNSIVSYFMNLPEDSYVDSFETSLKCLPKFVEDLNIKANFVIGIYEVELKYFRAKFGVKRLAFSKSFRTANAICAASIIAKQKEYYSKLKGLEHEIEIFR